MFPSPFQSAHPLRGAPSGQLIKIAALHISIHAPLAGCDVGCRSPPYQSFLFQSTHPLRGATITIAESVPAVIFQSTHPLRGATLSSPSPALPATHFNPRTPCGVRLAQRNRGPVRAAISIHAPLAGCDCPTRARKGATNEFQSTHPLRGATTIPERHIAYRRVISIHAPLAGCDCHRFTSPSWLRHFNPRTPCGVRQQKYTNFSVYFCDKRLFLDSFTQNAAF